MDMNEGLAYLVITQGSSAFCGIVALVTCLTGFGLFKSQVGGLALSGVPAAYVTTVSMSISMLAWISAALVLVSAGFFFYLRSSDVRGGRIEDASGPGVMFITSMFLTVGLSVACVVSSVSNLRFSKDFCLSCRGYEHGGGVSGTSVCDVCNSTLTVFKAIIAPFVLVSVSNVYALISVWLARI